jgi:hypothetical protein
MIRIWAFALALTVSVGTYATGTLQISSPKVEGNQVTIPVMLGGNVGTGISALDFRLTYNPEVLRPVSAGAGSAAASADKRVMANISAPGEYIVVMMGMNQTTCTTGEVAKIVMERVTEAPGNEWNLGIKRQTLSSLDGTVISSEVLPYNPGETPEPAEPTKPTTPDDASSNETSTPTAVNVLQTADNPVGPVETPRAKPRAPTADADRARAQLARALAERDRVRGRIDGQGTEQADSGTEEGPEEKADGSGGASRPTGSNIEGSSLASRDQPEARIEVPRAGGDDARTVETKPTQAMDPAKASTASRRFPRYVIVGGVSIGAVVAALALARLARMF